MNIKYTGSVGGHFRIGLKNFLLTIITLGIYRFWGKTNLRSYIWSHFEIFDQPFIYHGTALEILKAFLKIIPIYLVFLALCEGVPWLIASLNAPQIGTILIVIFYVVKWDRVNTLAFRRTLEYYKFYGIPSWLT